MINSRKIEDLHPTLQRGCKELIRRMKLKGYDICITATYRDNEYQNYLYTQGRIREGAIITNAKGGQSIHNYSCAFDICNNITGQEYKDKNFFDSAGKIWSQMGGEWGGSWKGFVDTPHFQFTNGLSLSQLQKGYKLPNDCQMKWEQVEKPTEPIEPIQEGETEMRYNKIDELPEWSKPTIQKMIDKKLILGDEKGLDLSLDMIRIFVINDRVGTYN